MSTTSNLQSYSFFVTQKNYKVCINPREKGRKSWNQRNNIRLNSLRLLRGVLASAVCSTVSSSKNNSSGRFGKYGGTYVPELLITCLKELEDQFYNALQDENFQEELRTSLRDYVGRETPLYFAERLTSYYKNKNNGRGPEIYLKREDLNHGGAHHINNALAQAMLAKRMGRTNIVTATGSGQHGVATAAACAKLGLNCTVFMGSLDIERQPSNLDIMQLLGAQVNQVKGSFKDASSQAVREWVSNLETNSYHLPATAIGPHPCPTMVREFQSVIGKEVRKQAMEKWGGKPDVLVACVGGGSNAIGLFHEFIEDDEVRLVGVEAAGSGLETCRHSATLAKGEVGVYHGAMSYLLQDDDGQIIDPHSIGVGLETPGVGPELSYLKETKQAEFHAITDEEALNAHKRLCRLEGIIPALETSHALAILDKLCPTLSSETKVVVNCNSRGDKDIATVTNLNQLLEFASTIDTNNLSNNYVESLPGTRKYDLFPTSGVECSIAHTVQSLR